MDGGSPEPALTGKVLKTDPGQRAKSAPPRERGWRVFKSSVSLQTAKATRTLWGSCLPALSVLGYTPRTACAAGRGALEILGLPPLKCS